MTIRRATPEVEIKEGDFILGNPFTNYAIVGHAGKVTLIKGKRLYYDRFIHDGLVEDTHMNRDQVRFVCDTKGEVDAVLSLSETAKRETSAAVQSVESNCKNRADALLCALMNGAQP